MKNPSQFSKTKQLQKGDFLVEALIGTFLTSLVAMGVMQVTSTVIRGQQQAVTQEIVVSQLREKLQNHMRAGVNACANGQSIKEIKPGGEVAMKTIGDPVCTPQTVADYRINSTAPARTLQAPRRIVLNVTTSDGSDFAVGGY